MFFRMYMLVLLYLQTLLLNDLDEHIKRINTWYKSLTIPVVFSFGFFMIIATSSLTSLINFSATPGCVCSIVTQMWMLWTDKQLRYAPKKWINQVCYLCLFVNKIIPEWVTWMGTGEYWDSSPLMWVHWINGRYRIHWSLRPPLRLLGFQTQTVPPLFGR